MKESPIFIKSYEMMVWLMGRTGKFPKNQRFLMAKRMEETALDFFFRLLNEAAIAAGVGPGIKCSIFIPSPRNPLPYVPNARPPRDQTPKGEYIVSKNDFFIPEALC